MKKLLLGAAAIILIVPLLASAHGHSQHDNGQSNSHGKNHITNGSGPGSTGNSGSTGNGTGNGGVVTPTPPVTPPTVPPIVTGSQITFTAYTTGYGYPDNTPAGNAISNPIIHTGAGGTGTYADPITLAVGHSITNGNDTLDYSAGTRFYVPNLRKYFIVEDTCGDGNQPQNGPCHTGFQGHVWIDLWVGGTSATKTATLACEDAITDLHEVIENPASNYAVVSGPVFNSTCAQQFGDMVVLQ